MPRKGLILQATILKANDLRLTYTLNERNLLVNDERRQFTRISIQYPVVLKRASGEEISGVVVNLSLKGLLVHPARPVTSGEEVAFHFTESEGAPAIPIEGRAIVVRQEGMEEIGLRLIEIDIEGLSHLRRLVELNIGDCDQAFAETAKWWADS